MNAKQKRREDVDGVLFVFDYLSAVKSCADVNERPMILDFLDSAASTIKVCYRNDPNIAKCIINSVKEIQPRLASGVLAPDFKIPVSIQLPHSRHFIERVWFAGS